MRCLGVASPFITIKEPIKLCNSCQEKVFSLNAMLMFRGFSLLLTLKLLRETVCCSVDLKSFLMSIDGLMSRLIEERSRNTSREQALSAAGSFIFIYLFTFVSLVFLQRSTLQSLDEFSGIVRFSVLTESVF